MLLVIALAPALAGDSAEQCLSTRDDAALGYVVELEGAPEPEGRARVTVSGQPRVLPAVAAGDAQHRYRSSSAELSLFDCATDEAGTYVCARAELVVDGARATARQVPMWAMPCVPFGGGPEK